MADQLYPITTAPSTIFPSNVFYHVVPLHMSYLVIIQILQVVYIGKQPIYFQETVYYCPEHKRKQQKTVYLLVVLSLFSATTLSKRLLNNFLNSLPLPHWS